MKCVEWIMIAFSQEIIVELWCDFIGDKAQSTDSDYGVTGGKMLAFVSVQVWMLISCDLHLIWFSRVWEFGFSIMKNKPAIIFDIKLIFEIIWSDQL